MGKKVVIAIVALCLSATAGMTAAGIVRTNSERQNFSSDGYVLMGGAGEVKQVGFSADASYLVSRSGFVTFEDSTGRKAAVSRESFVHLSDGSVMALSDGILLDFNDLSDNFVNNYLITNGLPISASGGEYTAETGTGTVHFGEHLWKLSDTKYLVESPVISVHFSNDDVREAGSYVQVSVSEDGLVQLLTEENYWVTISEECFIETESGVRIYPVNQLVDDGTYKLSVAKLAVAPDDAIILTEAETRRQIVPELNIETIDGEDGADGEAGQTGEAGRAGENGVDGETGEKGETGQTGESGQNGATGQAGAAGATGYTGREGDPGNKGEIGGSGPKGNDVEVRSSTKTALPVMTITDWQISSTSLKGTISISDTNAMLSSNLVTKPASITIYEEATGNAITCYKTVNSDYAAIDSTNAVYGYEINPSVLTNGSTLSFTTWNGDTSASEAIEAANTSALKPDTAYRLSVIAYYAMNSTIYSREFISRSFYTDSTGVSLSADSSTTDSVTINATVPSALSEKADVYMLTPEQNKDFKVANVNDPTKYVQVSAPLSSGSQQITFSNLTKDTTYVARARIKTADLELLTAQELTVKTLKAEPLIDGMTPKEYAEAGNSGVRSYYNRTTGAYEIYRPSVRDTDHGVVRYIYTAYVKDGDEWNVYGSPVKRDANSKTAVDFALDPGKTYKVEVQMEFFDNEKTVYYELGGTGELTPVGGTMPILRLNEIEKHYDSFEGTLTVGSLGESTALDISDGHPLTLEITANQALDATISLTNADTPIYMPTGSDEDNYVYKATLNAGEGTSNTRTVTLSCKNLKYNTQYAVTVKGYVNVNDGNNYTEREIGTASFRTQGLPPVGISWNRPASKPEGVAIMRYLQIRTPDDHVKNQLGGGDTGESDAAGGIIRLSLYGGSGTDKQLLGTADLYKSSTVPSAVPGGNNRNCFDLIYDNSTGEDVGMPVTEATFGASGLQESSMYTLEVTQLVDDTYSMGLGYINDFGEVIEDKNFATVQAQAAPPELKVEPQKGVTATPIHYKDATKYGGKQDAQNPLPDDAVVGYLLQAEYNNAQGLAESVTYYVYEYSRFYNALVTDGEDPVKKAETYALETIEYTGFTGSKPPAVAVMFGQNPNTGASPTGDYAAWDGSTKVYFMGDPEPSNNVLANGMGRGYRYVFAYTVKYHLNEEEGLLVYPYGAKEGANPSGNYNSFLIYGAGQENGTYIGQNVAYVLNSGMREAKCISPEFHSYVYDTKGMNVAGGTLVLHYAWRDQDQTMITSGEENGRTQLSYTGMSGTAPKYLVADNAQNGGIPLGNQENDELQWYTIDIPYTHSSGNVTVNIAAGLYRIDYSGIMRILYPESTDADSVELCVIPVDKSFEHRLPDLGNISLTQTVLETSNITRFTLNCGGGSSFTAELGDRIYAVKLTFQCGDVTKTFLQSLLRNGATYYVDVPTGSLGEGFTNVQYTVSATLYYDTGRQGWALLENDEIVDNNATWFAVQYMHQNDEYTLGNYRNASETGRARGALRSDASLTAAQLRAAVKRNSADESDDSTIVFRHQSAFNNASSSVTYVYPRSHGVAQNGTAAMSSLGDTYVVPKAVGTINIGENDEIQGETITHITPTVDARYIPGATNIYIWQNTVSEGVNANFTIYTGTQIPLASDNKRYVYVALYGNETDARALGTDGLVDITGENNPKRLPLNDAASEMDTGGIDAFSFTGLALNTQYWLVYYIENGNGENEALLKFNDETGGKAVYAVMTTGGVTVRSSAGAIYQNSRADNNSYFRKNLVLSYRVSNAAGIRMRFQILSADKQTVLYTHNELQTRGMISASDGFPVVSGTGGDVNTLTVDMSPGLRRNKLIPGGSYYLRLIAFEGFVDGQPEEYTETNCRSTNDGSGDFLFRLPPTTNANAVAYVANATKDSLTFEVSFNDVELSFMGQKDYDTEPPLYAVRFTDEDGNWIRTIYDDKIYRADIPKQPFTLKVGYVEQNNQKIVDGINGTVMINGWYSAADEGITNGMSANFQLAANAKYALNVYAVLDANHDGRADITDEEYQTLFNEARTNDPEYKKFFGEAADEAQIGKSFGEFVDMFWSASYDAENGNSHIAEGNPLRTIESKFLKCQRLQQLTDENDLLIDTTKMRLDRDANTGQIVVTLVESFGVVQGNNQQIQRVEWEFYGRADSNNKVWNTWSGVKENGEVDFVKGTDSGGYAIYRITLPDIPTGTWDTIKFRCWKTNDTNLGADYSKDFEGRHI